MKVGCGGHPCMPCPACLWRESLFRYTGTLCALTICGCPGGDMRILIAVSRDTGGCTDVSAAVSAFPWPADAIFSILSVAEIALPAPMVGPLPVATNVTELQRSADAEANTTAEVTAAELRSR